MTERERIRDGEVNDPAAEYPSSPTTSLPTKEEPVGERPVGGSARSYDAPEASSDSQRVLWVIALIGGVAFLLIVLVWAISVML